MCGIMLAARLSLTSFCMCCCWWCFCCVVGLCCHHAAEEGSFWFGARCNLNKGAQWPQQFNVTVLAAQQTEAGCWLNTSATAQYNSSDAQRPGEMDGYWTQSQICPDAATVGWTHPLRNDSLSKELAVWTDADPAALICTMNGVPGPVRGVCKTKTQNAPTAATALLFSFHC